MAVDLTKRAEKLDDLRSKNISEKLTLEEAQKIVNVWGAHLEHMGGVRMLFGINIPELLLPYPIIILQGALNKMEAYCYEQGLHDRVNLLEETETMLMQYANDEEAIKETVERLGDKDLRKALIDGLEDYQMSQMEAGYLVDKKPWRLSKARIEELTK